MNLSKRSDKPAPGTTASGGPSALRHLAQYALDFKTDALASQTLAMVHNCVLDCVAAALAGAHSGGAAAARATALAQFGPGKTSVWFSGGAKALPGAAILANCTAASIMDLDDGHRAACGHPGAAIIPSCLALAEEVGASHAQLIAAIVVGYEVCVRVAAGRDLSRLATLSSGKWCNYGVAAAGALLRGCTLEQMVQAMAIAGVHGPNQDAAGYSRVMGNHVKEGIPWSSLTGYMAVGLAVNGFTGPTDILDNPAHFDADAIAAGLGRSHAIERVYFKPYSCCRWAHAALDALLAMLETDGIRPEAVESIEVRTFSRALRLNNEFDPPTLEGAQYSIPYVLGVAAAHGRSALLPLTEDRLHDPAALAFARKVQLVVDPQLDQRFPQTTAARVRLTTRTGTHEREVIYPLGDPDNPMSQDLLLDKFGALTRAMDVRAVRDGLDDFRDGSYRKLVDALRDWGQRPLAPASFD